MLKKILNKYLEINLRMWDDNTKMDVKGTGFIFRFNSPLQRGGAGFLEKLIRLYRITIKYLKNFAIKFFSERIQLTSYIFHKNPFSVHVFSLKEISVSVL